MKIQMVDLKGQYLKIKEEVDVSIQECIDSTTFIKGSAVKEFQQNLVGYLNVKHVTPCANGTDALQIAMMALNLQPGDETICPTFTYVTTAEIIGHLGLKSVMVLTVKNGRRGKLQRYSAEKNTPSMIYYPFPLYKQEAFLQYVEESFSLPVTEQLCKEVISLPVHTEFDPEVLDVIITELKNYFN